MLMACDKNISLSLEEIVQVYNNLNIQPSQFEYSMPGSDFYDHTLSCGRFKQFTLLKPVKYILSSNATQPGDNNA